MTAGDGMRLRNAVRPRERHNPNPKRQRGVLARRSRSGFGPRCASCEYPNPKRERGAVKWRMANSEERMTTARPTPAFDLRHSSFDISFRFGACSVSVRQVQRYETRTRRLTERGSVGPVESGE